MMRALYTFRAIAALGAFAIYLFLPTFQTDEVRG